MPEIAYVNGTFCDLADARVSIEDRGFQFADGVYEVVVAYGGRVFRLDDHLQRLRCSLDAVNISIPRGQVDFAAVIAEGIARAGFESTMVYLQVTRGVAPRVHVPAGPLMPTVVATFKAKPSIDPQLRQRGLHLRTTEDLRWERCFIKSVALLPAVLAKMEALEGGYDDALFVAPDGEVREATAANVFLVRNGGLLTPPDSPHILHGVTRTYVLECAARIGIPTHLSRLSLDDLYTADEMFLSSTTVDVLAVTRVNSRPVAQGTPGRLTTQLLEEFHRGVRAAAGCAE